MFSEDRESEVRVFVYPPPVAPFQRAYAWRFDPLIADLDAMGFVTRNMSEAHVFLIVNHLGKSDAKAPIFFRANTNPALY